MANFRLVETLFDTFYYYYYYHYYHQSIERKNYLKIATITVKITSDFHKIVLNEISK